MSRKTDKRLRAFTRCLTAVTAIVLILGVMGSKGAEARPSLKACRDVVGTYLVSNADQPGGSINSRSLVIFSSDGGFQFIDSAQGGVPGVFNPFTGASGAWTCTRKTRFERTVEAIALDFTLPGSEGAAQSIARLDFFDTTINVKTGAMTGTGTLRFFPLNGDPLNTPPDNQTPQFFFEGLRVAVGAGSP